MKAKLLTLATLASLLLIQCKKEDTIAVLDPQANFLQQAKQFVKKESPQADYEKLDWTKAIVYKKDGTYKMVRVPLVGNTHPSQKTVYLTFDKGSFFGNYFELNSNTITTVSLNNTRQCIAPLTPDGKLDSYRVYENGQMVQEQAGMRNPVSFIRAPVQFSGLNFNLYYLIESLGLGQGGSNDPSNAPQGVASYLEAMPDGGELGGDGGGLIIEVDYIDIASKPAANIVKLFNCFDEVPDLPNTEYEITLNVDVPINSAPMTPYDLLYNPGHTFVTITKSYGGLYVAQNFGFYPNSGIASILNTSTSSKIVNDEFHEVNAKLKTHINQQQFASIKATAIGIATQEYNLESNNCADFALKLFNITRPINPITLPNYSAYADVPPVTISKIMNNAPQTLFAWLKVSKLNNTPDAPYITLDQTTNTVSGPSKGECN